MEILGNLLMCIGGVVALFGVVWLIVTVFRENVVWGIICCIVPIAVLAFVVKTGTKQSGRFRLAWLGSP